MLSWTKQATLLCCSFSRLHFFDGGEKYNLKSFTKSHLLCSNHVVSTLSLKPMNTPKSEEQIPNSELGLSEEYLNAAWKMRVHVTKARLLIGGSVGHVFQLSNQRPPSSVSVQSAASFVRRAYLNWEEDSIARLATTSKKKKPSRNVFVKRRYILVYMYVCNVCFWRI